MASSVPSTSASGCTCPSISARPGARSRAATTSPGTRRVSFTPCSSRARSAHLLEDRLDARGVLQRVIGAEIEVRGDAKVEMLAQPVAYEPARAVQRRHRGLPLRLVAEHRHEDLGRPQIFRGLDLGDGDETEPRVFQLPLQQHRHLFLDELVDAVESLALHQRISTVVSRTMPSTLFSMKSMALDTTSLA